MMEPESDMTDSQGTDLSSVRSDESVVRNQDGKKTKVKDMAFEMDDGTDDGNALIAYKQSLKISLAESAALEAKNVALELEVLRLKGEIRMSMIELGVLRSIVADTGEYRRRFGRPNVNKDGFTVPTD